MRCDVRALADELKEKMLVLEVEVADEREKEDDRFWVSFSPEKPTEFILTDGIYRKHPDQDKPGNTVYEVLGDATYVLIVTRVDERWAIKYAYFPYRWRLRVNMLIPEMRNFNDYASLSHEQLEQFLVALDDIVAL